jgi:hypothetical protein
VHFEKSLRVLDVFSFSYRHTLRISIRLRRASAVVCLEAYTNTYCDSNPYVFFIVKQWIRKNWRNIQAAEYPEIKLLEASAVVTAEKSRGWFVHSGYNVM